ncbi:MAG: OmpA family protein [Bacteroidales bacterium]|nr:OmpA family protein [Bacteroidales bacterium]MDZ4204779.1 OmpA family protein [Bacteroidales bacterium]
MRKTACRFLVILMILLAVDVDAQEHNPRSKSGRARREYYKAVQSYSQVDYTNALKHAKKALRIDRKFPEAYLLAADIHHDLKNYDSAACYYEKALSLDSETFVSVYNILGGLYFRLGRYAKSIQAYEIFFIKQQDQPSVEKSAVQTSIERSRFALSLVKNPVLYQPVNLGDSVNSANDEYVNVVSVDDKTLIFTVKSPLTGNQNHRNYKEEFFVSTRNADGWGKAVVYPLASGSFESEGALTISPDGNYLFFTSCHRSDGYGSCDLYYSRRQGEKWSPAQNMGPVINSSRWESQPAMSSDGRTLYYASNRAGGYGGSDIWKSVLQPNGHWGKPQNLGSIINTRDDEMSPFIHYDGQTLYFSSKGHPGLGGADLFISRLLANGQWSELQNLGYPINTHADEISLVVDARGDIAYISADTPGGKGGYDIYSFQLHKKVRPSSVSYIRGIVRDAKNRAPLQANFELMVLESGEVVVQSLSDSDNGEFLVVVPSGKSYALHVNKKGYLFYSEHFALDTTQAVHDVLMFDILLKPIEIGQAEVLRNIFFAHNSHVIEPNSEVDLARLVRLLIENPGLKIEIIGHTDNTGSREYNLNLSSKRAQAVHNHLIIYGIGQERLKYMGFGDIYPIDTNETPEGRARNRRTEFKIGE